jgi:hypothetical protein
LNGEEVLFFSWCRKYDGIRYDPSSENLMEIVPIETAVNAGGAIIFGTKESSSSSQSKAFQETEKITTIATAPVEIDKIIKDYIPSLVDWQITTPEGAPLVFGHSRFGNVQNDSPEGSLGEASAANVSKFLNQMALKYINPHDDKSRPFNMRMSDFLWTSPLVNTGADSGAPLELISEEIYSKVYLSEINTSDVKNTNGILTADREIIL